MQYDIATSEIPGGLRIQIETPAGAASADLPGFGSVAAFARSVMRLSDDFAAASRAAKPGKKVSCRKGCGVCCRQLVTVSAPEAFLVGEWLDACPEETRGRFASRSEDAECRLRQSGLLDSLSGLSDPALTDAVHYERARAYFELRIPCPFLEDESCGIYGSRPSLCREYLVSSPASRCADPFQAGIERLPAPLMLRDALAAAWAGLTGRELEFIPLPLVPVRRLPAGSGLLGPQDMRRLQKRFAEALEIHLGAFGDTREKHAANLGRDRRPDARRTDCN
jgi:Fe-S-cluster containining protein